MRLGKSSLYAIASIPICLASCQPSVNDSKDQGANARKSQESAEMPHSPGSPAGPATAGNDRPHNNTERTRLARTEPHFIEEFEPPAPQPSARERACGLGADEDARYGEIAELDFTDPASFDILDCIDGDKSAFSFHLNFLAADLLQSQGEYCKAGEYLSKGMQAAGLLKLASMQPSPKMEAVTIWQYDWYSKRLCEPRVRFERIVNAVARTCGEQTNSRYLQGILSELKQLPPHEHQWDAC